MAITLDGITLPEDLEWTDEFTAWKVGQVARTSLTGALIVHESVRQAGRPITLASQQQGSRWVAPLRLDTLRALQASEEAVAAGPFQLVMPAHNAGTRTFSCIWRREGGAAIEARPIRFITPYVDGDWFAVTLRLLQVD
ncbi:MAG TPA: hypothetical protein VIG97_14620 [Luteimonas sp.]